MREPAHAMSIIAIWRGGSFAPRRSSRKLRSAEAVHVRVCAMARRSRADSATDSRYDPSAGELDRRRCRRDDRATPPDLVDTLKRCRTTGGPRTGTARAARGARRTVLRRILSPECESDQAVGPGLLIQVPACRDQLLEPCVGNRDASGDPADAAGLLLEIPDELPPSGLP